VLGMGRRFNGLSTLPAAGGTPRQLTIPDTAAGETMHHNPVALPDGETVLFQSVPKGAGQGLTYGHIGVASLSTGRHTVLNLEGRYPLGYADGQLLYAGTDGALMAVPFDLRSRRITGTPVRVGEELTTTETSDSYAALADDGTLMYVRSPRMAGPALVDLSGRAEPLIGSGERESAGPRISPDGRRVAVTVGRGSAAGVWVFDIGSRTLSRLTTQQQASRPEWTPGGRRVLFVAPSRGGDALWWQPADGSGPAEQLFADRGMIEGGVFSPNGRVLIYSIIPDTGGNRHDLRYVELTGEVTPREFVATRADEMMPHFSPDGRWVAYTSDESGRHEVYVRAFPGPGGRVQVSDGGGSEPAWSPDGRRVFYRNGRQMLAAGIATTPALAVTGRQVLFEGQYMSGSRERNYDVSPDGTRFLMLRHAGEDAPQATVVLNWLATLRARTGAGGR
jgi:dipeptidyl aminopeptidase/acylaminoacyl peptidase